MATQPLTLGEVEYLAHRLAKELMSWDEPIPDFQTRFPNVLESCLAVPFQSFAKKQPYPTLIDKAAILFYLLIKNHPFQNGNKRIAVTTLLVFLHNNGHWLEISNQELYNFARLLAASPAKLKDSFVGAIRQFLRVYMKRRT